MSILLCGVQVYGCVMGRYIVVRYCVGMVVYLFGGACMRQRKASNTNYTCGSRSHIFKYEHQLVIFECVMIINELNFYHLN